MRFDVLTIFPEMFGAVTGDGIVGRAIKNGVITLELTDIRAFSNNKHKKTDDYPYGGGMGMVMTAQPICDAWTYATGMAPGKKPRTIYMSPQGRTLTQSVAKELAKEPWIVILCGRYEGVDERVLELIVDEEISVGDYVLTGGELPAMTLIDCVSRLVPGALPAEEAYSDESHFEGLLEYPQYTRPRTFRGLEVPAVLLSGHHKNIEAWRRQKSRERTREKRPDLPVPPEPERLMSKSAARRLSRRAADSIKACGAFDCGVLDTSDIVLYEDVIKMCEANACGRYGASWACPPAIGTFSECERRFRSYRKAALFSVKHDLSDSFDYEGMLEGKDAFAAVARRVKEEVAPALVDTLLIANAGCDRTCGKCSYPNEPCRRPGMSSGAIEGYGVMVSEVAKQAGIAYINGENTITYFGALLFDRDTGALT